MSIPRGEMYKQDREREINENFRRAFQKEPFESNGDQEVPEDAERKKMVRPRTSGKSRDEIKEIEAGRAQRLQETQIRDEAERRRIAQDADDKKKQKKSDLQNQLKSVIKDGGVENRNPIRNAQRDSQDSAATEGEAGTKTNQYERTVDGFTKKRDNFFAESFDPPSTGKTKVSDISTERTVQPKENQGRWANQAPKLEPIPPKSRSGWTPSQMSNASPDTSSVTSDNSQEEPRPERTPKRKDIKRMESERRKNASQERGNQKKTSTRFSRVAEKRKNFSDTENSSALNSSGASTPRSQDSGEDAQQRAADAAGVENPEQNEALGRVDATTKKPTPELIKKRKEKQDIFTQESREKQANERQLREKSGVEHDKAIEKAAASLARTNRKTGKPGAADGENPWNDLYKPAKNSGKSDRWLARTNKVNAAADDAKTTDESVGDTSSSQGRTASTDSNSSTQSQDKAAVNVQKFGRGIIDRRKANKIREEKAAAAAAKASVYEEKIKEFKRTSKKPSERTQKMAKLLAEYRDKSSGSGSSGSGSRSSSVVSQESDDETQQRKADSAGATGDPAVDDTTKKSTKEEIKAKKKKIMESLAQEKIERDEREKQMHQQNATSNKKNKGKIAEAMLAATAAAPTDAKSFTQMAEHIFANTGKINPTTLEITTQMTILGETNHDIDEILTPFAKRGSINLDEFKNAYVQYKVEMELPKLAEYLFKNTMTPNPTLENIIHQMKIHKERENVITQIRTAFAGQKNVTLDEFKAAFVKRKKGTRLLQKNMMKDVTPDKVQEVMDKHKKTKNATKIQSIFRGYKSRKNKSNSADESNSNTDPASGSSTAASSPTHLENESNGTSRTSSTKEKKWWPFSKKGTDDSSEHGVHDASTKEKKSRWSFSRKRTDDSSESGVHDASTNEKKSRWSFSRKRTDDSSGPSGSQSEDEVPDTQRKESTNEKKSWLKSLYQSTKKKKGQKNSGQGIKFSKRPTNDDDEIEVVPVGVNDRDRFRRKKNDNPRNRNIPDTDSEEKDDRRTRRTTDDTDPSIPSNGKWKQWYTEQDGVYYTLGSHVRKEKLPEWIQGVDWEVGKKRDEVENDTQYTNSRTNDSDYQRRDDEPDETQRDEDDDTESPSKPIRKTPEVWDLKMPIYLDPKEIQEKIPVPREELKFMSYKGKRMTLFYIIWSVIICIICFMGMVGWRKVENTSPMVRKDTLSCFQHPCILNKTHQSVHAFASDYMSMSQSISFQSPFMQTHVMNAEGISKMIPTWMSNGTTAYDVMDLCVLNERRMIPTWMSNGTTAYERHVEAPDDKTMIPCTQTENFCPIVTRGQAETCEKWLVRIQNQTSSDTWPSNVPAAEKGSLCSQYAETYASQPYQAQIICKMMRSPRMSLAHVQNNNYNLFSTHNEMYLAGCLNVIIGVFSCAIALSVLRQLLLGSDNLDYFAYSDVEKQPGLRTLDGLFSLLMIGQAFIVVTVYFGLLAKTASENHQYVKSMLLPTGSIIITAMSGAVTVLLVACSPFYRMGSVKADRAVKFDLDIENPKQDSEDDEDTIDPRIQKYTTLSMNRYHRFLLTRNDLCLAYCNFVTFPILVLIVYVKYEWYSIDVHIQRAFFSAVAVGALNIVEVSVMGVMYLVTEMDSHRTRRKYANIWLFAHSNLINFTVQFVFVMSKMAIFIPTILELKQNIRWTYTKDLTDQYNGQKNGNQPLVAVMVSSFVVNHILYIVWNVISNLGFDDKFSAVLPEPIDKNLCTFLLMNMIVILVLNYTDQ